MRRLLAVAGVVVVLSACGSDEKTVTRADFEDRGLTWPLTVDEVELYCSDGVVRVSDDGDTYALSDGSDWPQLTPDDELWAESDGANVPVSDLRAEGEQFCD